LEAVALWMGAVELRIIDGLSKQWGQNVDLISSICKTVHEEGRLFVDVFLLGA